MSRPSIIIKVSSESPDKLIANDVIYEVNEPIEEDTGLSHKTLISNENIQKEDLSKESDEESDHSEEVENTTDKLRKRIHNRKIKTLIGNLSDGETDECDTDLEDEKDNKGVIFDLGGEKVYLETCKELGVVPVSYFTRHMKDSELIMKHHGIGPSGMKAMAVPLVANTSVLVLDLEDNWLEPEGGIYLADMLKENCYITDLNLCDNKIGSEGGQALCDMLSYNTTLRSIDLSGNNLGDNDAPAFAAALLENNRISCLNLSHNNFGAESGSILGHAISENEALEILDLSWNQFRYQSGIAILDGVRGSSRLKKVNLSWNGLGNEGAVAAADLLKQNNVLLELDLSSNRIGLDGITAISKGLEANETLTSLIIGQNPMTHIGSQTLLESINNERSVLQVLDITEVWVDKNFEQLYQDMRESRELEVKHGGLLGNYIIKGPVKKPPRLSEKSVENLLREPTEDLWDALITAVDKHRAPLVRYVEQYDSSGSYKVSVENFMNGVKQVNLGLDEEQLKAMETKLEETVAANGMIDYSIFDY